MGDEMGTHNGLSVEQTKEVQHEDDHGQGIPDVDGFSGALFRGRRTTFQPLIEWNEPRLRRVRLARLAAVLKSQK
jgi:hypothetical protein